jgi:hypothetical protein
VAYLAWLAWGVLFALTVEWSIEWVRRLRARFGRAVGTTGALLLVALFLTALEVPRASGLLNDAGWIGVVLFWAGMLGVAIPSFRRRAAEQALARQASFDRAEVSAGADFFESPEAAALSGWEPVTQAHVIRTRYLNARQAEIVVDTVPSHPISVRCERLDPGWIWTYDISA